MDNNLKKSDESKVKVFIQGSADITGQNSFSGKLNEQYPFDKNQRIAPKLLPRPGCRLCCNQIKKYPPTLANDGSCRSTAPVALPVNG